MYTCARAAAMAHVTFIAGAMDGVTLVETADTASRVIPQQKQEELKREFGTGSVYDRSHSETTEKP